MNVRLFKQVILFVFLRFELKQMGIIQRQGIKNTIISYAGIALGFVSLMIVQPYFLKAEEIGLTRVLFSFSFLLASFAGLGIGNITIRFFPVFKNSKLRHHGFLGFVLIFPIIGMLITSLLIYLFAESFQALYAEKSALFNSYYYYAIPFTFFICVFIALSNYSMALFKTTVPALLNEVVQRVFFIIAVLIYAFGWISLSQFIVFYILIYALISLILLYYILREDNISLFIKGDLWNRKLIGQMLSFGLVFLLAGTASMGIKLLDSIILGQFFSLEMVGVYAIAAFIPTFIEAPANALDKIAAPRIADAIYKNDLDEINKIYSLSSRYLFALGSLLFLLVNLNIHDLLSFLPGVYAQGAGVVSVLSLSALFNLITGTNNALVFNSDRFYIGVTLLLTIAVLMLLLLYLFIPSAGLEGAAWAVCLSSIAYNLFKFVFIWIKFRLHPFGNHTLIVFTVLVLLYLAGLFLPLQFHPAINILFRTFFIGGLFVFIMLKTRVISLDYKNWLK